jgi:hypothetical protein
MALTHVLETARRLGIPVIITDEAGEAAQVIMPFDDFAAMVGTATPAPKQSFRSQTSKPRVTRTVTPVSEDDEIARALADLQQETLEEKSTRTIADLENEMGEPRETKEGFLEEAFYLEPLEDTDETK